MSQTAAKARRSRGRASPGTDERDECVPHTGALAVRLGSKEDRRQQARARRQTHGLDAGPQELPAERGTRIPRRNVPTSHTHRAVESSSSGRPAVRDQSSQDMCVDTAESWQNPSDERGSGTPTRSPRAEALVRIWQKQWQRGTSLTGQTNVRMSLTPRALCEPATPDFWLLSSTAAEKI